MDPYQEHIANLVAFADILVKGNHEFPTSDAQSKFMQVTDELINILVPPEIKEKKKMTKGCFEVTTSNPNIIGTLIWSKESNDIVNNISNIQVEMYLHRTKPGYVSRGEDTFWISINGNEIADTGSYSIDELDTLVVTRIVPVKMNESNEITIAWGGGGGPKGLFTVNPGSETVVLA